MTTVPVTAALILLALLYLGGWLKSRRTSPGSIPFWRAATFLGGLAALWAAAASPLAMLDEELLTAHMVQHILLMTVGPALILFGFPAMALGAALRTQTTDPLHRLSPARKFWRRFTHPVLCWWAATAVLIAWHIPAFFALGFRSMNWHSLEHATFFAAGLLFWHPVIPSRPGESRDQWSLVLYLFLATLPCDALSAFLVFCGRVVYPVYLNAPRHVAWSALEDQEFAGALMWTFVTLAYLIPGMLVTVRLLSSEQRRRQAC